MTRIYFTKPIGGKDYIYVSESEDVIDTLRSTPGWAIRVSDDAGHTYLVPRDLIGLVMEES